MEEPEKKSKNWKIFTWIWVVLALILWAIVFRQIAGAFAGEFGGAGEYEMYVFAFIVFVSGSSTALPMGIIYIIFLVIHQRDMRKNKTNIHPDVQDLLDEKEEHLDKKEEHLDENEERIVDERPHMGFIGILLIIFLTFGVLVAISFLSSL